MRVLEARHHTAAAEPAGFPDDGVAEVAFLGRSNVGKSSLINRLVGRRKLAHTSARPGKTRLVHFYDVRGPERSLRLVDLPGYGWARVPKRERAQWQALVEGYLEGRAVLRLAVLLVDLRRDPGEDETLLLDWLDERRIPSRVVVTKADKLKRMRRAERVRTLAAGLRREPDALIATSAGTGLGIEALWRVIDEVAAI